jgi:hypothetical protein
MKVNEALTKRLDTRELFPLFSPLNGENKPKQGCQIFLDTIYQSGGKIYQITAKSPNGHNMYPIAVIYIFHMATEYTNVFHSKALQNLPKFGFLV